MKLCSSMTLFAAAARGAAEAALFREVLNQYFAGVTGEATEKMLLGYAAL
jgi:uncharacterized protein (DUF1810 family)